MATGTSDSGIEAGIRDEEHLHLNSAFYQDMLVLRISFMINGKQARIIGASVESGFPRLYCSDTGMSVSISAVIKACTTSLHKHRISHSHVHCDDQSPLLSFQYRPGLIELLLPECAQIAQDVSTAVKAIFKRSTASVSIRVEAAARLYLISLCKSGAPETLLITPNNVQQCSDRLEEFAFSSSMFAEHKTKMQGSTGVEFINLVQILLKAADKWLPLGIHLHIPEDKLRKIGRDHCNLSDDCLFNMLQWWYHNSRPSWKLVMSALCEIDRRDIAKEISVKYGIKYPADLPMTKFGETINSKSQHRARDLKSRNAKTGVSVLTRICKDNIDSFEEVFDEMEQELERCKEFIKDQSKRLGGLEGAEEELRTTKSQLEEQSKRLRDLEGAEEELRTTKSQLEEQSKRLRDLEGAEEELRTTKSQLEEQSKRLRDLEGAEEELRTTKSEFEDQSKRLRGLEGAEEELRTTKSELNNVIEQLSVELEDRSKRLRGLEGAEEELRTTKSELNNVIEQLSVELEDRSKRLRGLEDAEEIWIDQLTRKEEIDVSRSSLRRLKRAMSKGSTTTIEACRQLLFAEIDQKKRGREVYIRKEEKRQLEEKIIKMKCCLLEKKLRLFNMECEQQLELPQDSAPQTEITELTDSLTEAIKKETEAESRVITAQKEYDLSVEAVNTKEALVQRLDSEARNVYPATLRLTVHQES